MLAEKCWTCSAVATHYCVVIVPTVDPETRERAEISLRGEPKLCLDCCDMQVYSTTLMDLAHIETVLQERYPHMPPRDWTIAVVRGLPIADAIDYPASPDSFDAPAPPAAEAG